jgi:hypothetical protein
MFYEFSEARKTAECQGAEFQAFLASRKVGPTFSHSYSAGQTGQQDHDISATHTSPMPSAGPSLQVADEVSFDRQPRTSYLDRIRTLRAISCINNVSPLTAAVM